MSHLNHIILGLPCIFVVFACTEEQVATEEGVEPVTTNEAATNITDAHEQLTERLISVPGVTGIGIGECEGKPCIKVMLERETPDLMTKIPSTYMGFPVVVEETGEIHIQDQ